MLRGDYNVLSLRTTDHRIGLVSQMMFTEPACANDVIDPFDLSTSRCQRTGRYVMNARTPLDQAFPAGFWGFPGDM